MDDRKEPHSDNEATQKDAQPKKPFADAITDLAATAAGALAETAVRAVAKRARKAVAKKTPPSVKKAAKTIAKAATPKKNSKKAKRPSRLLKNSAGLANIAA